MLSTGNVLAQLISSGNDKMGRWSFQKFAGKHNSVVTIVVAYQTCAQLGTSKGKVTAHAQQESYLRQQNMHDPNPRKHFRKDLLSFLEACRKDNEELILIGNFNEELGGDPAGMANICSKLGMIDVMLLHHGSDDIVTYARGRKRLDYAICTPQVTKAIDHCGYEPFNHRLMSDHCGFFLVINTNKLFGSDTQCLPSLEFWDIQSKHSKPVTSYIREKHEYLSDRRFFERLQRMCDSNVPNPRLAQELDRELTRAGISAGKNCRTLRKPQWSVKLTKVRHKVSILKRVIGIVRLRKDFHNQIQQIQSSGSMDFLIPDTLAECKTDLRNAQQEVREIVRESERHRQEEMEDRITRTVARNGKQRAIILRNIRKAEEMKQMFKKIRFLRKDKSQGGLNRIEVPVDDTDDPKKCENWRAVDMPDEILDLLRKRNQKHFGQAQGTPFTVPPLSEHIDFIASTASVEMILDGDYDASELEEITGLLIKHLKRCEVPTNKQGITAEEFVGKIRTWVESTTTSPLGIHLGHYHALIARHCHKDSFNSPECALLDAHQKELIYAHVSLINYALCMGISYDRWKTVVNIMLEKDPGEPKIHQLCVMHIRSRLLSTPEYPVAKFDAPARRQPTTQRRTIWGTV